MPTIDDASRATCGVSRAAFQESHVAFPLRFDPSNAYARVPARARRIGLGFNSVSRFLASLGSPSLRQGLPANRRGGNRKRRRVASPLFLSLKAAAKRESKNERRSE